MKIKFILFIASCVFLTGKFTASTSENTNPYLVHFQKAYEEYPLIPKGMLESIAFANTRIEHIVHDSQTPESCIEIPNAYGVMGLTLDGKNYFRNNLKLVAELSGISETDIINDPRLNILAFAKAYSSLMDLMSITSSDPAKHIKVLVALSELPFDGELQNDYALNTQLYSILYFLNNPDHQSTYNFPSYNINLIEVFGEENYNVLSSSSVVITGQTIQGNGSNYQKSGVSAEIMSANYGPAIWNPTSCNFSSRSGTPISAVTIHTVQGTYAGCISWFKNCSAGVSAHYVIRSSDGQVTQMVLEINKAWHVGNNNPYTIGIEHEGYINNAAWYTNAMYASSANLVKDICLSGYGIAPTSCYNGPSCNGGSSTCLLSSTYRIKGHHHFPGQSHTDPGINWNWPKYYCLINNCGSGPVAPPPPPSVSGNLCGNKTLTRATPPSGVTYYWQGTSCGTSTGNSASTYVVTSSGTYFLRARDNSTNVWSTCSSANVTVNQDPADPSAPFVTSSSCGLTVLNRPSPPTGVTFYWQGTTCGTSTANSALSYSVTTSGTYYLRARSSAGCWSNCSSLAVNVIASPATPPIPSVSNSSCGPKTLTRATPPAGTTYFWQGTSCGTSTLNSAATYPVGTSGTYFLRAKNTQGCWSNCSSIAVNIIGCPSNLAATVGGACPSKSVALSWVNSASNWTVEVSLDPAFNTIHSKPAINVSTSAAPAGFSPALVFQANATYYWRIKSGTTYFNGPTFTVPFCDMVSPSTNIAPVNGWQNGVFTVNFTDVDNNTVGKSFYNVADFNGTEWRANGLRGFLNDNFDNASLHADWTTTSGAWATAAGNLAQSDDISLNTNLYASLTQNLSNRYMYHWSAKIDGNGTAKKAGLHFFCDNAAFTNRGNSYLVQFNIDGGKLEFYKSINNVLTLAKETDYNFLAGQYYDYNLIYDRITGKMDMYINNVLIESWIDAAPLTSGNSVSFKTNNASLSVNYFEVLRSRNASTSVSCGNSPTNDIRYQNSGFSLAGGKINSVITDLQGNISNVTTMPVNVDWTAPLAVTPINDGTGQDINTTTFTNQLAANWAPTTDPNSGITKYYYSIGINPGDTSVTGWTDNGSQSMALKNNLALTINQVYYFNVKAKNGAGMFSPVLSSNGQTVVVNSVGIEELSSVSGLMVYPNPFNESTTLDYTLTKSENTTVTLTDILGRAVYAWNNKSESAGNHRLTINASEMQLPSGLYFIKFATDNGSATIKLILNR